MRPSLALAGLVALAASSGCSMLHSSSSGAAGTEYVALTGANEVPPVTTSATGQGSVTVAADCSVKARVTYTGMEATAAHIHTGAAGTNGKVIVPLKKEGDAFVSAADAKLDAEGCAAYKAGQTYVNVHSDAHKGGEIRAQLKAR